MTLFTIFLKEANNSQNLSENNFQGLHLDEDAKDHLKPSGFLQMRVASNKMEVAHMDLKNYRMHKVSATSTSLPFQTMTMNHGT